MPVPDRTVTRVSWHDLCPWLIVFRTLPIAASITVLAFAMLGVVLVPLGWITAERVFLNDELRRSDPHFQEFVEFSRSPYRGVFDASRRPENYLELFGARLSGSRAVFERTVLPFRMLFRGDLGVRKFSYLVCGSLWTVVIWSFAGLSISRYALLRLTREEILPIDDVWQFGLSRWLNCLSGFLILFLVLALLTVPCFLIGLLLASNLGSILGSLLWVVVIVCSLAMAAALFGLMFGWPLMVTSVAAENQNALDAVTRSLAYVYQRPLNYALYGLLALVYGGFCWLIVSQIAGSAIHLTFWTTSWGASAGGIDRIHDFQMVDPVQMDPARAAEIITPALRPTVVPGSLVFSSNVIRFFNGMLSSLAVAFLYGLFWCMASAVYLLLRFDVDETEMDEVYLDEDSRSYELPPLKSDVQGVPQIQPLDEYLADQRTARESGLDRNDQEGEEN